MADNVVVQPGFVGGEWSPLAQGTIDDPLYHKALNLCSNALVMEEGAWTRRSGTLHGGYTNRGGYAKSFQFPFGADAPYIIEISYNGAGGSNMTFWRNGQRVTDSAQTLDNAHVPSGTPATFTTVATLASTGWATGDDILIQTQNGASGWPSTNDTRNGATLINRVFTITATAAKTFTMVDAITGTAVNAADFTYDNTVTNTFHRVTKNTCPYTTATDVSITRAVCCYDGTASNNVQIVLLNQSHAPVAVTGSYQANGADGFAGFTKSTPTFVDGPYVIQEGGALTLGAASGTTTFTHAGTKINGAAGFTAADIGRSMRILTMPAAWASGTSYNAGDTVTLGTYPDTDASYTALVANSAQQPDQHLGQSWVPYTNGRNWTWATITTVTDDHSGTLTFQGPNAFLYTNVVYWQMDYFNAFWGYPYTGAFSEGRLWLAGVTGTEGRFDASKSSGTSSQLTYTFSPTNWLGQVGDSDAISYTISDPDPTNIVWIAPDPLGMVLGLEHSEYTLRSASGDALTPTNLIARRASGYGSGYLTDYLRVGTTLTFIDRTYRRLIEYITDTFSNKLSGRVMNKRARHIGRGLFRRLALQDSSVPIVWAQGYDNSLYGVTYRRIGTYVTTEPEIVAWHRHSLGSTWGVTDIADSSYYSANATLDQAGDTTYLTTYDGSKYHMEIIQPTFDTENTVANGWFLDSAPGYVVGRDPALDSGSAGLDIYGLSHLNGKTVTAFIAGLDCGTHAVASGKINVPYGSDSEGLLTAAYLVAQSGSSYTYGCPIDVKNGSRAQVTVPVVVGFKFTSEGQTLRPANAPDIMTPKGTGLAKIRRLIQYGALLNNTGACSFGSSASFTYPAVLTDDNGTVLTASQQYTGVHFGECNDNPSLDGMLYWSTNSCYPMTVSSTTSFLATGER